MSNRTLIEMIGNYMQGKASWVWLVVLAVLALFALSPLGAVLMFLLRDS